MSNTYLKNYNYFTFHEYSAIKQKIPQPHTIFGGVFGGESNNFEWFYAFYNCRKHG